MSLDGLTQATLLAWKFDSSLVAVKPGSGGASYINHATIKQRFLFVTGAPDVCIVDKLYGDVQFKRDDGSGKKVWQTLPHVLVGVVLRMRIEIDGVPHVVEATGSCEHPQNEPHDGERAKKAESDAYKRCAMQLGNGLQSWAKGDYTLGDRMAARDRKQAGAELAEDATHDEEVTEDATGPVAEQPVPSTAVQPERPATGEQGSDAGQATAPAPPSDQYSGGKITPDTLCPNCGDRIGDHTVKKQTGLWVHRVCPSKAK